MMQFCRNRSNILSNSYILKVPPSNSELCLNIFSSVKTYRSEKAGNALLGGGAEDQPLAVPQHAHITRRV